MNSMVGSRWIRKDNSRTVEVVAELSEFCGERQFMLRNMHTQRETRIGASGLRRKFRPLDQD